MPSKRFTTHQALTQNLADDSDASDYGNDSDFESEISPDSCHDSDSRSESDAAKPTATQPHACQSSRGQVHGRRRGTCVAQSERGRGAATNVGPCANCDNVDSDNSGNYSIIYHLVSAEN